MADTDRLRWLCVETEQGRRLCLSRQVVESWRGPITVLSEHATYDDCRRACESLTPRTVGGAPVSVEEPELPSAPEGELPPPPPPPTIDIPTSISIPEIPPTPTLPGAGDFDQLVTIIGGLGPGPPDGVTIPGGIGPITLLPGGEVTIPGTPGIGVPAFAVPLPFIGGPQAIGGQQLLAPGMEQIVATPPVGIPGTTLYPLPVLGVVPGVTAGQPLAL